MYPYWMTSLIANFNEWGAAGTFLAMFLEGVSIPFPSAFVVGLYGVVSSHYGFQPWITVFLSACGYTLGSLGPYFIGRTGGRKLLARYGRLVRAPEERLAQLEEWFARFGDKAVMLVRPFFFGTYISYLAGMARMRLERFVLYTFCGIAPWIAFLLFGSRYLRVKWSLISGNLQAYGGLYLAGAVVLVVLVLVGRCWKARFK